MKKCLVFVMVIALATSSLFAFSLPSFGGKVTTKSSPINGYIGLDIGPAFAFGKKHIGDNTTKLDTISLALDIDGATYFNKGKNQFGLGYGMRFDFPLSQTNEVGKVKKEDLQVKFRLAPNLTFQYKYAINKDFYLHAGAGASITFYNTSSVSAGSSSVTTKVNVISLLANVGFDYKVSDKFGIMAGLKIATPISTTGKVTTIILGNTKTSDYDTKYSGVSITPFVGAAFLY